MDIELVESPTPSLIDFFENRIEEFNLIHWEIKEKKPLAVQIKDEGGNIVAGAAAKTFGLWLLLDNLWVSDSLRGQKVGSKILLKLEEAAIKRGCQFVLLNTLNFQAMPFYEKHGYKVEWIQKNYPRDGCKYFMTKCLV
jgi:GNAT superfamily N-acetyltransferase